MLRLSGAERQMDACRLLNTCEKFLQKKSTGFSAQFKNSHYSVRYRDLEWQSVVSAVQRYHQGVDRVVDFRPFHFLFKI